MAISKGNPSIALSDILSKIGEGEILSYYLGIKSIPCVINSPLRQDTNPSFGIYSRDGKKIYFTDFGNGDKGNTFSLLMQLWGLSFYRTLDKIDKELCSSTTNSISIATLKNQYKVLYNTSSATLDCKVREWRQYDLDYWSTFGISKNSLIFGKIYPISHIFINKEKSRIIIPADKYAYVYIEFKDNKLTKKIYQPFNEIYKWWSEHDKSVWDLWNQLPETGDNLIITSSRKDILCIWENTGIPATGLQGEGYIPKIQVIEELKSRFKNIYILYDNDFDGKENWGRIDGEKLAKEFDLKQIEIPEEYQAKDPSDLFKKWGQETLIKVINNLIYKNDKE